MTTEKRAMRTVVFMMLLAASMLAACTPRPTIDPGQEQEVTYTTFEEDKETYPPENGLFPAYRLTPGDVLDVLFQIETIKNVVNYTITANDTLSIKFVRLPDLNETQRVRPDGNISLAYIGDVEVVGLTPGQLKDKLEGLFSKYFKYPELYVTVDEFRERIKELKKDLHTASRGLSRLVTVRPDGYATFPLAGDMLVAHKTLPQVKQELDDFYVTYLDGLHVDVFLQEHAGSVIYVMGQVTTPGSYKINKPVTLLEAMTLAEGPTPEANLDKVLVFRRKGNDFKSTVVDLGTALSTKAGGQFFYLMPDDIVYVAESRYFEAARVMDALRQIILFRGWNISWGGDAFDLSF